MIWLYRSRSRVGAYKTFEDVCDYFMRLERFKAIDQGSFVPGYPGAFPERWDFSYIPCTQVRKVIDSLRTNARLTEAEKKAYEDGFDLLEMCAGDPETFRQIVLFPDVDVGELARDWGFAYAHARIFSLLESVDGNDLGAAEVFDCGLFPHGDQVEEGAKGKTPVSASSFFSSSSLSTEYEQGA